MGKRGKNKNRGSAKAKAQWIARKFAHVSQQRHMENILSDEEYKDMQSAHRKVLAEKEKEVLSTTIFVTNVKDLKIQANVEALNRFFSRYGPISECKATHYRTRGGKKRFHRFPPGQVRFVRKQDAEKVFGGVELLKVRKTVQLDCPTAGNKGKINVKPSMLHDDMIEDELRGTVVTVRADKLTLGHWCPHREEMPILDEERKSLVDGNEKQNEWLEVFVGVAPILTINLSKSTIELLSGDECDSSIGAHLFSFAPSNVPEFICIRFKQLALPLELCRDQETGAYSLIFAVKYPPKLEVDRVVTRPRGETEVERERSMKWGNLTASDFGHCLGFKLSVTETQVNGLLLHENCEKLRQFGVLKLAKHENPTPIVSKKIGFVHDVALESALEAIPIRLGILVKALLGRGKFSSYHAMKDKVTLEDGGHKELTTMVESCLSGHAEATLERMLGGHGRTKFPCRLFYSLLPATLTSTRSVFDIPDYCVSIPRMQLSPSRELVVGFEVETSNRVIRKFTTKSSESFVRRTIGMFSQTQGFKPESFLRLHVTDEDSRSIFDRDLNDPVAERLKKAILSGIMICGRKYIFLAYSSSQLKECSVWMVCLPPGWTVKQIRSTLGDFSSCKSASKYAARIGQCFSTTISGAQGQDHAPTEGTRVRHAVIDDIYGENQSMCHSDGTGMIRRCVLNQLLDQLPFSPKDPLDASIIQIRFGGAKGTLTAWDDPSRLARSWRSADVYLRKSMVKFEARYEVLEVCSVGKHVPYYLNRNVILLLSAHGVPDFTFLRIQRDMIHDLDQMLVSREKAIQLLPRLSGPDSEQRSMLLHMLHCGFSPKYDPFLLDCLFSIRSHHLYNLRKKARIFIEKGGVLMGGIDETGLVPEGAVFCQLRTQAVDDPRGVGASYEPITGPVMVTKHPVMHPGDVRMLLAIDVPELRTNRNMILFSRHGKRPEADKMSGSDLDGDEFAVCWDERLFLGEWNGCRKTGAGTFVSRGGTSISTRDVPHAIAKLAMSNQTAMDFSGAAASSAASPPLPSSDNDLSEALLKHFLDHIKMASVGRICMLWLDYAAEHGAKCPECIELAKLHSIAVDYPKSGIPAEIPIHLRLPHTTPRAHWREKKGTPSYHCKSIVGQLYDEVIRADDKIPVQSKSALAGRIRDKHGTIQCFANGDWVDAYLRQIYNPSIAQRLGLCTRHESTLFVNSLQRFGNNERKEYEEKMLQILNRYSIRGEGELYTGCIRKYHKLYKKRQNEFSQDIKRQYRELRKQFRSNFFQKVLRLVDNELLRGSNSAIDPVDSLTGQVGAMSMDNDKKPTAKKIEDTDTTFLAEDSEEEGFDEVDTADEESYDEEAVDDDDDNDDDEEAIRQVEEIVTRNYAGTAMSERDSLLCRRAQQLAAAYYDAAYSPDFRWNYGGRGTTLALFSFPWIVADVLAMRMLHLS